MGGDVDLAALYAIVPAAEEEDLLEEVAADRVSQEWERLLRGGRCMSCWYFADGSSEECCAVADVVETVDEEADEVRPLSPAQVLALVAYELGAVVVSTQSWAAKAPRPEAGRESSEVPPVR